MNYFIKIPEFGSQEAHDYAHKHSLLGRYPVNVVGMALAARDSISERLSMFPTQKGWYISEDHINSRLDSLEQFDEISGWHHGNQASFMEINEYVGIKMWGVRRPKRTDGIIIRDDVENQQLKEHDLRLASFAFLMDEGLQPLCDFALSRHDSDGQVYVVFGYIVERAKENYLDYMIRLGHVDREQYKSYPYRHDINHTFKSMTSTMDLIDRCGKIGISVYAEIVPYNFGVRHFDGKMITFDYGHCHLLA